MPSVDASTVLYVKGNAMCPANSHVYDFDRAKIEVFNMRNVTSMMNYVIVALAKLLGFYMLGAASASLKS